MIDILVGLAQVALRQNKIDQAVAYMKEVLNWIDSQGIISLDNPFWVCLKSHHVLTAATQTIPTAAEWAEAILNLAYKTLQEQAASLSGDKVRRNFLENISIHAEIIAAWEGQKLPSHPHRQRKKKQSKIFATNGTQNSYSDH
jgi:hypothetical protein